MTSDTTKRAFGMPSLALLPVRLVTGWMFFSAFHRRVILEPAKLDPASLGYLGEKFNTFMPGSALVAPGQAWKRRKR